MAWQEQVSQIVNDKLSGSLALTSATATALIDLSEQASFSSIDALLDQLVTIGEQVLDSQTGMASVVNLYNRVLFAVSPQITVESGVQVLRERAQAFLAEQYRASTDLSRRCVALMTEGLTICTYSYSSTVLAALKSAGLSKRKPIVICHEGRPGLEGRRMAQDLAAANIDVTLTVDAAMFSNVRNSEMVIVGADALSEQGIVSKLGTATLTTCARWLGVPCYVLADTNKIWPFELGTQPLKERDPGEIWDSPPPGVRVANRYYDTTSWDAVSGVVTEQGLLTAAEVRQLSRERVAHTTLYHIIEQMRNRRNEVA
ncbi:MAG: hypothetical protein ABI947_14105 [Chloroflexota bacterium]